MRSETSCYPPHNANNQMTKQTETLKICIDARCKPGKGGGVSQAVMSLVHTLGMLDGPETYAIVIETDDQAAWLQPMLGPNQRLVMKPTNSAKRSRLQRLQRPFARYATKVSGANGSPKVTLSDGFYERLECDIVHFPTQKFVLCAATSIYNPHDLQHLHLPSFFTPAEIAKRETIYQAGCRFARVVVVGSQWIKDDVVNQYGISSTKVQVIPEHPPTEFSAELPAEALAAIEDQYRLQRPFAVYPAVTWPHKNHLRLLDAIAYLRDSQGLEVRLVCTGSHYESHWPRIDERLRELKLKDQVKFLGFIPARDLRAIYRLSQFLIMPTLFEASSLPIFEAWLEGTAVACSDVTALPDQVLDAAWLFDPYDTISIADAIFRMTTDAELRERLRRCAYRRLKDFDWERTAKAYRAVYRRAAGRRLNEEDHWLLNWDWMQYPERKNMEVWR